MIKKIYTIVLAVLFSASAMAQLPILKGVVRDAQGPVTGAVISVQGTTRAAATDAQGIFSIGANKGETLRVSFFGCQTQTILLNGQATLDITLTESAQALEEVVVVGYGSQRKVDLTGAVASVSGDELSKKSVTSMGQALQGVIPNLNVSVADGKPNAAFNYNIRGGTSFDTNGNVSNGSPLVLIDGVEGDINMFNANDIESLVVLKDASSAAIYGARAAFGVILVTTKKGSRGDKVSITYGNSFQWNMPAKIPDIMDSYNGQSAMNQGKVLMGGSISAADEQLVQRMKAYQDDPVNNPVYYDLPNGKIQWVGNTNPYKEGVAKSAFTQKHNFSLSGGSEKTTYYASFGLQEQDGMYKRNNDHFTRYNALVNVNTAITKWWDMGVKGSFNQSIYSEPVSPAGKGGFWYAMGQGYDFNVYMPIYAPESSPLGAVKTDNILGFMDNGSSSVNDKRDLMMTAYTEFKILPGLSVKADYTFSNSSLYYNKIQPEYWRVETDWNALTAVHTQPDHVQTEQFNTDYFALNAYINYDGSFNGHNISAVAGYNQEETKHNSFGGQGLGITSMEVPTLSNTSGEKYLWDSHYQWAIRGFFVRANYNYKHRYFIGFTGRYDGTSKFQKDTRFAFFPSASAAWRISEESFMDGARGVLSNLKIRGSWGQLGNQNVGNYPYQPTYNQSNNLQHIIDGRTPNYMSPPGLVSSSLTWETATTVDIGLDLLLWNKLEVTFDWYNRKTTNILTSGAKFPSILGASAPMMNSGTLDTKGWELAVKWGETLNNGFHYDVGVVVSDNYSVVERFDGNPNNLISSSYAGSRVGDIWGYRTDGIFQTPEEVAAAPDLSYLSTGKWYPGELRFKDLNGDGKVNQGKGSTDDSGDRVVIGNSTPRYMFGVTANLAWKGLDFNIFFQGVGKRDWFPSSGERAFWGYLGNGAPLYNVYERSWTPENRNAYFTVHTNNSRSANRNDYFLQDAWYVRLKNVQIGYTLPQEITRKFAVQRLRFYVSGYNLWEMSGLKSPTVDPEVLRSEYPIQRSVSFGLQVTF